MALFASDVILIIISRQYTLLDQFSGKRMGISPYIKYLLEGIFSVFKSTLATS